MRCKEVNVLKANSLEEIPVGGSCGCGQEFDELTMLEAKDIVCGEDRPECLRGMLRTIEVNLRFGADLENV